MLIIGNKMKIIPRTTCCFGHKDDGSPGGYAVGSLYVQQALWEQRRPPQMEVKGKLPSGKEERLEFLFVNIWRMAFSREGHGVP